MVLIGRELLLIHLIEEQFCTQGSSIADKSTLTVVKLVNLDMLFSDNLTQAEAQASWDDKSKWQLYQSK